MAACKSRPFLFHLVPAEKSGIHFNNQIQENDQQNILKNQYLYNGGGVGIGDFNNDGLQDIYFTGNTVSNKLYLNRGHLQFEDITDIAKVTGEGHWCSGVSVVDINNDGWMDIYVCATFSGDSRLRSHLLYINQGLNKEGIPTFREMSAEYGLSDTSYSTNAAFFDYDGDGDLDLYIINNKPGPAYQNSFSGRPLQDTSVNPNTDELFENTGSDSLGHPYFRNVTRQAGIRETGYGLGLSISDLNNDGWPDIFVSNDFISSDVLYINNQNKTFTDKIHSYLKHTSFAAMGNTIGDINNDGLPDIIELDMNPEDNFRKKMMLNGNNYNTYQNFEEKQFMYQYTRNTLQLNQGPRLREHDSLGDPVFSEIGLYAGISATDWSWTPLLADFDNDGFKDLIITNGFPKDLTDHDFMADRYNERINGARSGLLSSIPSVKLKNYAYRNEGDLRFKDVSETWRVGEPSFSNGAAYADLDNDGDLDYVVNNINDKAFVFENTLNSPGKINQHFLRVVCNAGKDNRWGIGAVFQIFYDHGKTQTYENSPYRGYLSTVENTGFFGLGKSVQIDSLLVRMGRKKKVLKNLKSDQTVRVDLSEADDTLASRNQHPGKNIFSDLSMEMADTIKDEDYDFIDFNMQHLLTHKLSEYGPALAVGDINGDGLDDMITGGSYLHKADLLLQGKNGRFRRTDPFPQIKSNQKTQEDLGMLLFDADQDGDPDLYITSGSNQMPLNSVSYQDRLYVNDGRGHFTEDSSALPKMTGSKICVKACDFDRDGDLDLFIGERVVPGFYPEPASGHILRNDSKPGKILFTDITSQVAPGLDKLGLITDAIFTDVDNDGWIDLLVVGEWMAPTLFMNKQGHFINETKGSGLEKMTGFWNSICSGDFNNDGKTDYVIGNLGENSYYQASPQFPLSIYSGYFNQNNRLNAIPSLYLPADKRNPLDGRKEFPVPARDDLLKEVNSLRKNFPDYASYARAAMDQVLPDSLRKSARVLRAGYTRSCLLINLGNGKFKAVDLPAAAQLSCIYGMVAEDLDMDGNLDLVLNGNDFGTEVYSGRYDALNGLYLRGDGKGGFLPLSILQSGICIPGDGKALVSLRSLKDVYLLAASQHNGPVKIFRLNKSPVLIPLLPNDASVLFTFPQGRIRKEEFHYGSSFLSQSGRFFALPSGLQSAVITDFSGRTRTLQPR